MALKKIQTLFQTIFDSIPDAAVFTDTQRRIVLVNPAFTSLFGYKSEEALGRTTEFSYRHRKDYVHLGKKKFRTGIEPKPRPYEIEYLRKDGTRFWGEVRGVHVKDDQGITIGFFGINRDVTDRKKHESDLISIAEGMSAVTGEQFFLSLVKKLADVLSFEYAYMAEFTPNRPGHARTLGFLADDHIIDNIEVKIAGTPCEKVALNGHCSCPEDVRKLFPDASVMAYMKIEAYFGIRLCNSFGVPIGLLSVMSRRPVKRIARVQSMLKIFGVRAQVELERLYIERELTQYRQHLEQLVKERTAELDKQKNALEHKNIALRELLQEVEIQKNRITSDILANINELVMPVLKNMKAKGSSDDQHIDLILQNLHTITSPFGSTISSRGLKLTPR